MSEVPDPIERGEICCENWAIDNLKGDIATCCCGKEFDINLGKTLSSDPYAIPVCPDCFAKAMKENWWSSLEKNKEDLLNLVAKYHPCYKKKRSNVITATQAERICQTIRNDIVDKSSEDPFDRFNSFLENHNSEMVSLLNELWFGMPESVFVRSEPGFFVVCNLCEDAYVLYEEE